MAIAGISKHRDTCERCGKQFMRAPGSGPHCFNCQAYIDARVTLVCGHCGKKFEALKSRAEKGKAKYCSNKCVGLASRASRGNCAYCGALMDGKKHQTKYCSRECVSLHAQELRTMTKCAHCGAPCYRERIGDNFCCDLCAYQHGAVVPSEDPYARGIDCVGFDGSVMPGTSAQALPVY